MKQNSRQHDSLHASMDADLTLIQTVIQLCKTDPGYAMSHYGLDEDQLAVWSSLSPRDGVRLAQSGVCTFRPVFAAAQLRSFKELDPVDGMASAYLLASAFPTSPAAASIRPVLAK